MMIWPCQKCGYCCTVIPIDRHLIEKNRDKFQRIVKEEIITKMNPNMILICTIDSKCVFLTEDNLCSIYDERPQICRDYGLSGGPMECPKVAPSGRIRGTDEIKRVKKRLVKSNLNIFENFSKRTGIEIKEYYPSDDLTDDEE